MIRLAALFCGIVCGIGLLASGLFEPSRLQAFLNPIQAWDPTLGLGLLSAFIVAFVVCLATKQLASPLLGGKGEPIPDGSTSKSIAGALLFGLGWGLAGYFPLAAFVSLGLFAPGAAIFLAAVLAGMILHDVVAQRGRPATNPSGPLG